MKEFIIHSDKVLKEYEIAVFIKGENVNKEGIEKHYINPMDYKKESFITFSVPYDKKAPTAKLAKGFIEDILPKLVFLKIKYILCADSAYFKYLTKVKKTTSYSGYALPVKAFEGFEDIKAILVPNYHSLFYNPAGQHKIDSGLDALKNSLGNQYTPPGDIIQNAHYPDLYVEVDSALNGLYVFPELTVDIETRSLEIDKAGIETIAFSWNDNSGIAFCVEKDRLYPKAFRALVKEFLTNYKGRLTYHNASFDIRVLIYELWMKKV